MTERISRPLDGVGEAHRRADIQGLRALAVLAVVAFHLNAFLPGGFVGVDMFFVISGFVITLTLLRDYAANGRISLPAFYLRRFRRLAPALGLVIVVTLMLSALVLSPLGPQQTAAVTGLAAAVSLANVSIALTTGGYFDAPAELNPLLHTWSLSVEEQFYLVFPLLLVLGLWWSRRARAHVPSLAILVGLATAVSFFIAMSAPLLPDRWSSSALFGFYSPITRAWEFGVGALVALWARSPRGRVGRGLARLAFLSGAGGLVTSMALITSESLFPGPVTLLPVLATAALIVSGTRPNDFGTKVLSWRPLTLVGDWSYSIYLWHWPFVSLAGVIWPEFPVAPPLAALVSLIPAVPAYYLVEQRFRFQNFAVPRRLVAGLGGFVGVPLGIAATLWLVPTAVFGQELEDATARPAGYELGCHVEAVDVDAPGICEWPAPSDGEPSPPIYLVGDSNAQHYVDGLIEVATELRSPLQVMTVRSCPFLTDSVGLSEVIVRPEACSTWTRDVVDILDRSTPGTVIISTSDHYWTQEAGPLRLSGQDLTPEASTLINTFTARLTSTVSGIRQAGHRVVLVQTVPHWFSPYHWNLEECSLAEVLAGCEETMPIDFPLTKSLDVREALHAVAANTGAEVIDFTPTICPSGTCSTRGEDTWVYRDENHITNSYARQLAPLWLEALTSSQ